jgi:hypothetical protein
MATNQLSQLPILRNSCHRHSSSVRYAKVERIEKTPFRNGILPKSISKALESELQHDKRNLLNPNGINAHKAKHTHNRMFFFFDISNCLIFIASLFYPINFHSAH